MALPLSEPPWPASLAPLTAVDDLLRCGICFDYFSIAMIIPQCSHNYCSLCIRKFLSFKTQCPTCCVAVSESDLKNNRILDELVKSFNSARQQLFQLVLDAPQISSPSACSRHSAGKNHVTSPVSWPKLKEEVPVIDRFLRKEEVCTPTKADGLAGADQTIVKTEECHDLYSSSAEVDGKGNEVGSQQSPECTKSHEKPSTSVVKVGKKVDCPVCEVAIPEQFINKHLDSCLTREEKKDSLRSSSHKRKPMSKVVYNLLSDRDLKKKLKEHGLSTRGTRQQLIKRHQEFVHMYNAQCDSLNPKSVAEVVKELEETEKIRVQLECNKTSGNSLTFTKDQTEEEIDEIHTDYQSREEHHPAVVLGEDQILKTETPDGKSESPSLKEGQRSVSPALSLSPESTSSSSSDILRDLQEPETCSASSDNSSFLGLRVNKRKAHRPQMPENNQALPKSKRKKS
ncbi:E3 ubiquitin-protein ligase RAD18 isoform X3 [Phalacrocorax aristotelis]|uniref:E3 ubiquitin-protein ligase RAD18 isoform X3 n=1 Tax=Phalacrocorax aristotelis TaxID=126867 RepID=UPI003F4C936D